MAKFPTLVSETVEELQLKLVKLTKASQENNMYSHFKKKKKQSSYWV